MIQSRPFHVKHYLDLEVEEFVFKGAVDSVPESVLYRLSDSPYMKTLCNPDGFPIMVIGIVPINVGVGEVFMLPGKGWTFYTIEVCRIIKNDIKRHLMFHHRIQAMCKTSDDKYCRFLEMFGFEREGVLRHYNRLGEDYYMYSLISGG